MNALISNLRSLCYIRLIHMHKHIEHMYTNDEPVIDFMFDAQTYDYR